MELIVINVSDGDVLSAVKELIEGKFKKNKYVGVFSMDKKVYCLVMDKLLAKLTFVTLDSLRTFVEKNLYELNVEKKIVKKISKGNIDKIFSDVAKQVLVLLLYGVASNKVARLTIGRDLIDKLSLNVANVEGGIKIENTPFLRKLFNLQQD